MRKSATKLGKEYGLNAQEMNRVLYNNGYIDGEPGNYYPTEKGKKFTCVSDQHRGCGGSPWYNRDWYELSYDESILDEIEITEDMKRTAKEEVVEHRKRQREKKEEITARYELEMPSLECEEDTNNYIDSFSNYISDKFDNLVDNWEWKHTFLVVGIGTALYGVHKAKPYVKKWWNEFWEEEDA